MTNICGSVWAPLLTVVIGILASLMDSFVIGILSFRNGCEFTNSHFVFTMHWDDVNGIFHRCRYKIDYYSIELRRKYYSNSRSPRVIHTKLKDQVLVTLRTCPQDKYFPKANEYLTLAGGSDTESDADRYFEEQTPLVDFEETILFDEDDLELEELLTAATPQTPQTSSISQDMDKAYGLVGESVERLNMRSVYDIQEMLANFPFTGSRMQNCMGRNALLEPTKSVDPFHTTYQCLMDLMRER